MICSKELSCTHKIDAKFDILLWIYMSYLSEALGEITLRTCKTPSNAGLSCLEDDVYVFSLRASLVPI